jgi:hypothetical protein
MAAASAHGEIFVFSADKLSTTAHVNLCNEKMNALADKIKDQVEILGHGCEVNKRNPHQLDGYIEYEAEQRLKIFDTDRPLSAPTAGFFSRKTECIQSITEAEDKFTGRTGLEVDLAYCFDDGLYNDKTPFRFRLVSFADVDIELTWFKKITFGQILNHSKNGFKEYLTKNLQGYGVDLFTLGYRSSLAWSEIIFGTFSNDMVAIRTWTDMHHNSREKCIANTQIVSRIFHSEAKKPAAIFCTREAFGKFKLNIWGVVDNNLVFRIKPLKRVYGTIQDCQENSIGLSGNTLGSFCARDNDGELRSHAIVRAKENIED